MRVCIIGGGVIGLCSAYYLRKQGYDVTVVERNDLKDGCSFGNMGYISPSHFVPLATPGIISQGIKWMMSSTSPFYVKPRLNLDLIKWGMTFWKKANARNVEQSAPHLNNLLQLSRKLTAEMQQEMTSPFNLVQKGCWMLYKSEKTGEHEKHLAEQAASFGLKTIHCTQAEVQDHEKDVEVNVAGGVLYLDDCHLNAREFMEALFKSLKTSGVKFWINTSTSGFETENKKVTRVITDKGDIECDELLIANGSWMGEISKKLGVSILMQPGKGYSVDYHGLKQNLLYPSILVDDRTATTPINDWLRIGGTMELSGHSDNILPKRVMAVYQAFQKYYPTLELPLPDPTKAWYGYRPVSPDGMPYIGRHPRFDNLIYAGGHAMLGVSAAAGTGLLMEQIISHKTPEISLEAFRPDRFSS